MQNKDIEEWFQLYGDNLLNYLIYSSGSKEAEDLLQEVFTRAIKYYHTFNYDSTPKTWLFSIARNVAINYHRKVKFMQWMPEDVLKHFVSNSYNPEEDTIVNEQVNELYSAINQLNRNYRDIIVLRGINQLSVSETADILQWSDSKVKTTYHRAIQKINLMLSSKWEGGKLNENRP